MARPDLHARTVEVLTAMASSGLEWHRPMDVGGHDGSHHSRTLAAICERGWVERMPRISIANERGSSRGSYRYRLTSAGRTFGLLARAEEDLVGCGHG